MMTDAIISPEKNAKAVITLWQESINSALNDTAWRFWDGEIQRTVDAYNKHLADTPGYQPLSGTLIKAVLWAETGARHGEWYTRPMRGGASNDDGLCAFLRGTEGGELIIPPAWKLLLLSGSVRTRPEYTLRADVGYLLKRMALFSHQSIVAAGGKIFDITVKPGDSIEKIARHQGATVEVMLRLNPGADLSRLHAGQVLKCRRASIKRCITGWRAMEAETIAQRYGSDDPLYATKLRYAFEVIEKGKAAA